MSAATDPTASGPDAAPAVDASRLEQPSDAVPMESISQSTNEPAQAAIEESHETPAKDDAGDASVKPAVDADADAEKREESSQDPDADISTSPKGKDKETEGAPKPPSKERQDSVMAIGPAQDDIKAVSAGTPDAGPVCNITLLLTSGARHPYKLDSKYLSRRNVTVPEQTEDGHPDPFSISTYTLKELILREWRSDWEAKPASPTSIRLIHFGKLLEDKEPLKKYQLSPENRNVVHMSVRPQDLDEEEPKTGSKNQGSGGGDGQRARSGGCCVVL